MKKLFFLFLFIFVSEFIFSQSGLSGLVSYLGKSVPNEFNRISETTYENNGVILNIENNIVISSGWTEEYDNFVEADFYYSAYCKSYLNTGWIFFQHDLHCDVYKYADIYVVLSKPALRIDGVFVIITNFYLEEYYDTLIKSSKGE